MLFTSILLGNNVILVILDNKTKGKWNIKWSFSEKYNVEVLDFLVDAC